MWSFLFFTILSLSLVTGEISEFSAEKATNPSFVVDYENGRFLLDGEPFRYISGDIHYFRIHPDQWLDRLKRVRALGFNAIQYYVPWNYHEVERGIFDFSGQRDIVRFSQMAAELGMYTLLRWGPYVCTEWENGGLPYWLIARHHYIEMRTNNEKFIEEVSRWFAVLATRIRPMLRHNGGPVLMVQIENEYGSYYACDHSYTAWLRDETKRLLGDQTVLFTTDGSKEKWIKCGSVPGVLPTIDFGPTKNATIYKNFELLKRFLPGGKGPLVNSEFYPGWLVMWGQKTQSIPSAKSIAESAKNMLDLGASGINFYMIYGGTNFGFWNGAETNAPVITSYDYTAPISEAGDYISSYWAIRNWIKSINGWTNQPTTPPNPNPRRAYGEVSLKRRGSYNSLPKTLCVSSTNPLSFEQIGQQFGYVLYYTRVPHCTGKSNLTIAGIKDFGYVRMGGKQQETFFVNEFNDLSVHRVTLHSCEDDDLLEILVENQGRQTFETINDYKGILSPVFLNGHPLYNWTQCALWSPYEDLVHVHKRESEAVVTLSEGLYTGHFNIDEVADTWVGMRGWGKGHVEINGNNIGRYWSAGPQYNLYVPAPLLRNGRNSIVVFEIIGNKQTKCTKAGCILKLEDHADIKFEKEKFVDAHLLQSVDEPWSSS